MSRKDPRPAEDDPFATPDATQPPATPTTPTTPTIPTAQNIPTPVRPWESFAESCIDDLDGARSALRKAIERHDRNAAIEAANRLAAIGSRCSANIVDVANKGGR